MHEMRKGRRRENSGGLSCRNFLVARQPAAKHTQYASVGIYAGGGGKGGAAQILYPVFKPVAEHGGTGNARNADSPDSANRADGANRRKSAQACFTAKA